ncbi:homocysteine S-methyltransferase [Crossiella sp. SN42]|uniref:homocysteine S-methyltransferase n=1 Tax=Crossiella sp. SN42 TaxID=2944808 RepID=UPI00207D16D3|nr:homocysteine S-methyltransferase [Crossiella sp. SN42]MCO1580402.1 homocysteine S-methyltransferase [Crossiella sp. SN42]
MRFSEALTRGPLLLDGGLSTALEQAGQDLSGELWSARLLLADPAAVRAAHLAYLRAGAQVVITGSYQVSYQGFARRGMPADAVSGLLRRSVRLAAEAAAEVEGPRWVAASVGPYGAVLADGSEYRGGYGLSVPELAGFHRQRIEVLASAGPDVLAVETIPDLAEAEAILGLVAGLGLPVWLSFHVRDGRTGAGQPLAEAFALAAAVPEVVAVGVNCCAPAEVAPAIEAARQVTGKPVVVYPNGGGEWDAGRKEWSGPSTVDPAAAVAWADAGAGLIGGCCQVGPAGIARLASALRAG